MTSDLHNAPFLIEHIQCYGAEKAMAPHFKCSCLENPMDGGAW